MSGWQEITSEMRTGPPAQAYHGMLPRTQKKMGEGVTGVWNPSSLPWSTGRDGEEDTSGPGGLECASCPLERPCVKSEHS